MSDVLTPRPLGRTGLPAPALCVGTSSLGSIPRIYGYEVGAEQARQTLRAVFAGPIRFVDTSNSYGGGESERRIGAVLREIGGLPPGFLLSTKVDPDATGDFSGRRVRASLDESRERLGMDHLPLVYLHDPERIDFGYATGPDGPVRALLALRDEGRIGHLGVAGGPVEMLRRYVGLGHFEAVITHNRYTLLDRSAEPLLDDCADAGVAVLNAAPFGGGILVKGPEDAPRYAYRDAPDLIRDRVREMARLCAAEGVPLAAAALQFSLREPRIAATVVGITRPERLAQLLEQATVPLPETLWPRLERLVPDRTHWLD
ncbi:aldo/keto reductase [Dactylosporangium sp. CA-092794]|uniref:aldo/keto reductase n=1 Tax=Dactylosporangium sp. CA-092794 TaxID=3239929 RepID=UPI003D89DCD5